MYKYDIIIIGGGITGLAFACLLAQQSSLSIAVLEAKPHSATQRVSAMALSSQKIFAALQVWKDIHKHASPFRAIDVWDAAGKGEIHFDSKEIAAAELGYIIENDVMHTALLHKISQYPQIKIITPITLTSIQEQSDGIMFISNDGREFKTKLAIAADGANSWLRQQAQIPVKKKDYQQHAIVATVKTSLPHHAIARQVFLRDSILAHLPLQDAHTSSIVWSLPQAEAMRLMEMTNETFAQQLSSAFEYRLGDVENCGERQMFPLFHQQAESYIKPHLALMGDAAHTVHPLAGQGLNMGLQDAMSLADVIIKAVQSRRDFSSHATLRAYERWRKAENSLMSTTIDLLKTIFASDKKTIHGIRSFGLNAVDRVKVLKSFFISRAV